MNNKEKPWKKFWPHFVPRDFHVDQSVSNYLKEIALKAPDRVAIDFYGRAITYGHLNEMVEQFAEGLIRLGLKKGDRVALHMQNCPQFVISFFGILRAGGVVVCLSPMFKHMELKYEIEDSQAKMLIGLDILYPEVEKIRHGLGLEYVILTSLKDYLPKEPVLPLPPEAQGEKKIFQGTFDFQELVKAGIGEPTSLMIDIHRDLALIQYTGGTTGIPKGAMITHHALAVASIGNGYWFNHSEDDVHLGLTPFFHILGMVVMMCSPLLSGGKLVVLSRFAADVVARAISHYKCTAWVAAPTMLIALLQLPDIKNYDLSSLRYICSGGASALANIQERIKEIAPYGVIAEGYGLTESVAHGGAVTPLNRFKSGFVGVPHLNDMKIVDIESGLQDLPPNQSGEIVLKGPAIMSGYWNKPDDTKEVLKDGWLYTGDVGFMDDEGYLRCEGRKKELIKCSGYSVFPPEVEGLLHRHPAVAEAAVIGVPDRYRGESPKAFIVLKPQYKEKVKEEEIIEWCKENMAAYKRPRVIEFRDSLPKSAAGKILKRLL